MDIHNKELDVFFNTLSLKYGCSKLTVKRICSSEFECVKQTMKKVDSYNDHFPYIKLPFLFSFLVKKGKQKFYLEKSAKNIKDVYTEIGND